jgi:hypothetical protein
MSRYSKPLAIITTIGSLFFLSGCVIAPDQSRPYGSSPSSYGSSGQSGASRAPQASVGREWDRGCADAKAGSYDRSGNAGQAYEDGWNACREGGASRAPQASVGREWDRGCADAKAGSYDRSGNASQAYEDGWNACKR